MKTLLIRSITGLLFISVVITAILLSGMTLFNVFLLCTCVALYEYRSLLSDKGINLSVLFYGASLVVYFIVSYTQLWSAIPYAMLFSLVLVIFFLLFVIELFRKQENPLTNTAYSILGIIWIVIPLSLINHIPLMIDDGKFLLLAIFIFVWTYDTFAYCVGRLLGKHRLMPRVSPLKSWEGAIGSAILTIILAFFMPKFFTILSLTSIQWIILAIIIVVSATIGDLTESLFKRQLSVKDSGNILPGHGGFLDRFDSILFVVPFVTLYLIFSYL